jgi:hypothetical protein
MAGVGLVTVSLRRSTGGMAFDISGIVKASGTIRVIAKWLLRLPVAFTKEISSAWR